MDTQRETSIVVADQSLFNRIGGEPAIQATITEFYKRVLADPLLKPFFRDVDMSWLKQQQFDFFVGALGGPQRYRGADMKTAHRHLAIEEKHFAQVATHLVGALKSLNFAD